MRQSQRAWQPEASQQYGFINGIQAQYQSGISKASRRKSMRKRAKGSPLCGDELAEGLSTMMQKLRIVSLLLNRCSRASLRAIMRYAGGSLRALENLGFRQNSSLSTMSLFKERRYRAMPRQGEIRFCSSTALSSMM